MSLTLSIILPTFNEGENIKNLIPEIQIQLESFKNLDYEIIVVDDGSSDDTVLICNKLSKMDDRIKFLSRLNKNSLPLSIYDGIINSKNENVMWLDADGSMTPIAIEKLLKEFFKNTEKVIVGSRFVKSGGYKGVLNLNTSFYSAIKNVKNSKDSVIGMVFSIYFNKIIVKISNSKIKDLTSGFIVGNKQHFERIVFEKANYGEYFIYLMSSLILKNVNIEEIGYICETRKHGKSKTANNLIQLFMRGVPYIIAAYNFRKSLNEKSF